MLIVLSFMAPVYAQSTNTLTLDAGSVDAVTNSMTASASIGDTIELQNGNTLKVAKIVNKDGIPLIKLLLTQANGKTREIETPRNVQWTEYLYDKNGNLEYTYRIEVYETAHGAVYNAATTNEWVQVRYSFTSHIKTDIKEKEMEAKVETPVCSDSDPEDYTYIRSTLTSTNTSLFWHNYQDYCIDKKTLVEMQCSLANDVWYKKWYSYKIVDCEARGEVCQEGVCVKPAVESAPHVTRGTILILFVDSEGKPMKNQKLTLHYSEKGNNGASIKTNEYGEAKFEVEEGKIFYVFSEDSVYSNKYRLYGNAKLCDLSAGEACTDTLVVKMVYQLKSKSVTEKEPIESTSSVPSFPSGNDAYTVIAQKGWNLLSVPLARAHITYDGCDGAKLFVYNSDSNSFKKVQSKELKLKKMESFWIKAKGECKLGFEGEFFTSSAIDTDLKSGWNLIGAPKDTTAWDEIHGTCEEKSGPWSFNTQENKWERSNTLQAGTGYVVKVSSACELGSSDVPPTPPN